MPSALIQEDAFQSRDGMIAAARTLVVDALEDTVREKGRATLALAGGSTPKPLYEALSQTRAPWDKVSATLTDERWVGPDHPASNEAMIRASLLTGHAGAARFLGLKTAAPTAKEGLAESAAALFSHLTPPVDAAVLGMGPDGHTLSWFPHAQNLAAALDPAPGGAVTWVRALPSAVTGEYVERMTLTFGALRGARLLVLLLTGPDKREAFDAALAEGPVEAAPVRALLRDEAVRLHVLWAP